jgi:phage baseplate assembly protein W
MRGFGAKLPLVYNKTTGPYELLLSLKQVAAQNLKMLLLTSPGERVMDSFYGVGLRNYLFSNDFEQTKMQIQSAIREQVSTYMDDDIEIISLLIERDQDFQEGMRVKIEYFIKNYNAFDDLSLLIK